MNRESVCADVIVVGAGPVGLWLAHELVLRGVSVVVLERDLQRHDRSRAMTIQPRTVELLACRGRADSLLATGRKGDSGHYAMLSSRLDYTRLDSPYPYIVAYPQLALERELENYLVDVGVQIRRGHRLSGVRQRSDAVEVSVDGPDGEYAVEASYVIGCDGGSGATRSAAGIDLDGTPDTMSAFHAEVQLDSPPPRVPVSRHSREGAFLCYPLPDGSYRLAGVDPEKMGTAREVPLELEEVRETMLRVAGSDFGLHSPIWLHRIGSATRQAREYMKGRVLLAGDAAHLHWPMGGIGLNLGIQDASNLGWKLAAVISDHAPVELLNTYHTERHPVGARAIEQVRAQSYLVGVSSAEGHAMRSVFSEMIASSPSLNLSLARSAAGLDVEYSSVSWAHPLVGSRAADIPLEGSGAPSLFAAMRDGQWLLVHCAREMVPTETVHGITQAWSAPGRTEEPGGASRILVRPDGYVAWATDSVDGGPNMRVVRQLQDHQW